MSINKSLNKKKASAKQVAQRLLASANAVVAIQEKARVRRLSQVKLNRKTEQILLQHADTLARHAIIPAIGVNYIYKLNALSKKNQLVTDPIEIGHALDLLQANTPLDAINGTYYFVTVEKPDIKAIQIIWDRMFGKPQESVKHSGTIEHHHSLADLVRSRKALPAHVQQNPFDEPPKHVEAKVIEHEQ